METRRSATGMTRWAEAERRRSDLHRRGVYPVFLRPDGTFNPWDSEVEKGMTTLGFVLKEGIVIAADHPSGTKPNIVPLNHCMVATISGGKDRGRDISSFTSLINSLQSEAKHVTSVHNLLTWLADTISAKKEYYSSVGILIAVWNESERGLYKVNGDGVITENDILATGSGSAVTIMVKMKLKCIESGVSIPKAAEIAKTSICFVAYESPHYGDAFTTSEVRASKSTLRRIWKNIKASSLVSPGPRLLEKDGDAVARRLCSFAWFDGFLVRPKCCKGVDSILIKRNQRTWNFLKNSVEKFSSVAGWP
ncbi:proteasome subunit beta type [Striga asiatica]|uniref:Proteasome subunit beta type n=1 Tax=Striga asiatica TaxID=4170 RepID=A0A5A7QXW9_STRAF|nr:proteasome subunit beta type [Striga asiatica]